MPALTPERQFADLLTADPARPFVTYYDEATGERSELSVRSCANWVAKTHHLLRTELGLGIGDTALLAVPAHWVSVPILLGCLTAGLSLTDAGDADVAFVAPTTVAAAAGAPDVYAVAPQSAAVGFNGAEPDGTVDYVLAVRPQADAWGTVQLAASADDRCLPGLLRREVVVRATAAGLPDGARVLTTRDWAGPQDWLDTVLAPLAAGGSLVIVRNGDEATVERRMTQERATVRI